MDDFKNFVKVTVGSGYDASAVSIGLSAGHGARLPVAPFNMTWWNSTDYADPTDDPNREIITVTAISTDTLTITRASEGTSASTKNTAAKTYRMVAGWTAKSIREAQVQLNARGYHRGLKFDGTASTRLTSTLTGQNVGTGDFSVWARFEVPTANPSGSQPGIICLSSSSTTIAARAFSIYFGTSGQMICVLFGATTSDQLYATISSVVANYGGQVIDVVFTRTGSTIHVYINGVDTALSASSIGTAPTWDLTVTSTYLHVGILSSGDLWKHRIYRAAVFNLALSQSEITDILWNDIPFKFKWGSFTEIASNGAFASDTAWTKDTDWTIAGGVAVATAVADATRIYQTSGTTLALGKTYRTVFDVSGFTAGAVKVYLAGILGTSRAANATSITEVLTITTLSDQVIGLKAIGTTTLNVDNFSIVQIGAFVDLDLENADPAVSTTVQDRSSNALDGTATSTGITSTRPLEQLNAKAIVVSGLTRSTDILEFGQVSSGGSAASDSARIYAKNNGGTAEIFVKDEGGTETQISAHAFDGPAWLYDDDDPFPRVVKEANYYVGWVRYINESRRAKLLEMLLSGEDMSGLSAEQKKVMHVEKFTDHNSRLGLSGNAALVMLSATDWDHAQNKAQAAYNTQRLAELAYFTARFENSGGKTVTKVENKSEAVVTATEIKVFVRPESDVKKPMPDWLLARI
jgi:hypothetical protein